MTRPKLHPSGCASHLGERAYDIVVGPRLIEGAGREILPLMRRRQAVVVTDETVAGHYLAPLRDSLAEAGIAHHTVVLPPGEETKDLDHFGRLAEEILALRDRARHDAGGAGRRRGRRCHRLCRRDPAARHRLRADPDDLAGPGRQLGRRQNRDQYAHRQEPDRRLLSAAPGPCRHRYAGDLAAARAARRLCRDGQIRPDPRRRILRAGASARAMRCARWNRTRSGTR